MTAFWNDAAASTSPLAEAQARLDQFRAELLAIYARLDAEIEAFQPVCVLSGRCCRFEEYGHTLFATTLEVALLAADAPPAPRPLDAGASCPWQDAHGRCTARSARPLGCRVYFCDPAYEPHAPAISARFLDAIRDLAARHGLASVYAPLHTHLRSLKEQNLWSDPAALESTT